MDFSLALDHTQLAIPPDGETLADSFYVDILGFEVREKPPLLVLRRGRWYQHGPVSLHLGVDPDFVPSNKSHIALKVTNYEALLARLEEHGIATQPNDEIAGVTRCYVRDPFLNRLELIASK